MQSPQKLIDYVKFYKNIVFFSESIHFRHHTLLRDGEWGNNAEGGKLRHFPPSRMFVLSRIILL